MKKKKRGEGGKETERQDKDGETVSQKERRQKAAPLRTGRVTLLRAGAPGCLPGAGAAPLAGCVLTSPPHSTPLHSAPLLAGPRRAPPRSAAFRSRLRLRGAQRRLPCAGRARALRGAGAARGYRGGCEREAIGAGRCALLRRPPRPTPSRNPPADAAAPRTPSARASAPRVGMRTAARERDAEGEQK